MHVAREDAMHEVVNGDCFSRQQTYPSASDMSDATRKVLFALIRASKSWCVSNLFMIGNNRDDWTSLATHSQFGKIRLVVVDYKRQLTDARQEDVKKIWEISESFLVVPPTNFMIGGGQGEEPEANWERLVEFAGFES